MMKRVVIHLLMVVLVLILGFAVGMLVGRLAGPASRSSEGIGISAFNS